MMKTLFRRARQGTLRKLSRTVQPTGRERTFHNDEIIVSKTDLKGHITDNAFAESFTGKVRAECIDQNWFLTLDDAQSKCKAFRREYNEERPHSAIGNRTPMELMETIGPASPPVA